MTTVSVVIPTFNRQRFIEPCINSVLGQTRKADEIIVVDDGSTDQTWKILRQIGFSPLDRKNIRVRYVFQNNKGVSAARNIGIKSSKYEYIAFLDSDDLWLEKKLERQLADLESQTNPCRLSHTDEIWYRNGVRINARKRHLKSGGEIYEKCLKLCCISPSSSILKKSVFDDLGFFDEKLVACEDYDFWLRYCASEQVHFLQERLIIKNGGHNDQLSNTYWGMDRFRVLALEKLLMGGTLNYIQKH